MIGVFRKDIMPTYLGALEILAIPNVMLVSSETASTRSAFRRPPSAFTSGARP